jgi:hypothetical protein
MLKCSPVYSIAAAGGRKVRRAGFAADQNDKGLQGKKFLERGIQAVDPSREKLRARS